MNRFILAHRTLSSTTTVTGRGQRFSGKVQLARHTGNYPNVNGVEIAPGEHNESGFYVDHLKPRGNFQGWWIT